MAKEERRQLSIDFRLLFEVPTTGFGLNQMHELINRVREEIEDLRLPVAPESGKHIAILVQRAEYRNWGLPDRGYVDKPGGVDRKVFTDIHAAVSVAADALEKADTLMEEAMRG